jgi:3-deoxy-D-manno-octulosonic-acid transferase
VAAGVPVLFGPHTEHVAELQAALLDCGAGRRVDDADALGHAWADLATHPDEHERRVASGRELLAANRGALQRAADLVLAVWDRSRSGLLA